MNNKIKNKKGITLITLIITIIVLLILATISILTITGQNEIIKTSQSAKQAHVVQSICEKLNFQLNNIVEEQLSNHEDLSRVKTLNKFSELNYDTRIVGEGTENVKCYIDVKDKGNVYTYEIQEKADGTQEVVLKAENDKPHKRCIPGDPPTCTTAQICIICGNTINPALGHKPDRDAATCTEDQICTVCLETLQYATGHKPNINAATCEDDQVCEKCGTVLQAALGHNYQFYNNDSSEIVKIHPTKEGNYTYKCANGCGKDTKPHAITGITAKDDTQHYLYKCSCGLNATENHIPGPEATCTSPQVCTVCNKILVADGHKYGSTLQAIMDSNGTNNSAHGYLCTLCGHPKNRIPHSYGAAYKFDKGYQDGGSYNDPDELHKRKCSGCNDVKVEAHNKKTKYSTTSTQHQKITYCNTYNCTWEKKDSWKSHNYTGVCRGKQNVCGTCKYCKSCKTTH